MTNMKVKRQFYYPNFVGEKEKKMNILFYLAQLSSSIILC